MSPDEPVPAPTPDATFLGAGPGFLFCAALSCLFVISTIALLLLMIKRAGLGRAGGDPGPGAADA